MIAKDTEAEILRLYHTEAWPVGTIAAQLSVHEDVVRRVLSTKLAPRPRPVRPTMLDPFMGFIEETLRRWPTVCASRLYDMCVDQVIPRLYVQWRATVDQGRQVELLEADSAGNEVQGGAEVARIFVDDSWWG